MGSPRTTTGNANVPTAVPSPNVLFCPISCVMSTWRVIQLDSCTLRQGQFPLERPTFLLALIFMFLAFRLLRPREDYASKRTSYLPTAWIHGHPENRGVRAYSFYPKRAVGHPRLWTCLSTRGNVARVPGYGRRTLVRFLPENLFNPRKACFGFACEEKWDLSQDNVAYNTAN